MISFVLEFKDYDLTYSKCTHVIERLFCNCYLEFIGANDFLAWFLWDLRNVAIVWISDGYKIQCIIFFSHNARILKKDSCNYPFSYAPLSLILPEIEEKNHDTYLDNVGIERYEF